MLLCSRFVTLLTIFYIVSTPCKCAKPKARTGRHLFALLGYYHGFKFGQSYAYQLPHIILPPVVVIPTIHQQQSVNVLNGATDENYQENGAIEQMITNSKLVINKTATNVRSENDNRFDNKIRSRPENSAALKDYLENKVKQANVLNNDTTENLQTSPERSAALKDNVENKVKQANVLNNDTTENKIEDILIDKEITTLPSVNNANLTEMMVNSTTEPATLTTDLDGPYPKSNYSEGIINGISLTTAKYVNENSTIIVNGSIVKINNHTNMQLNNLSTIQNPMHGTSIPHNAEIISYGPYSTAIYDDLTIDQISITTEPSINKESPLPPSNDFRWQKFSLSNKYLNGFKPLSGLYYDGFLHRPLLKKNFFQYGNQIY